MNLSLVASEQLGKVYHLLYTLDLVGFAEQIIISP